MPASGEHWIQVSRSLAGGASDSLSTTEGRSCMNIPADWLTEEPHETKVKFRTFTCHQRRRRDYHQLYWTDRHSSASCTDFFCRPNSPSSSSCSQSFAPDWADHHSSTSCAEFCFSGIFDDLWLLVISTTKCAASPISTLPSEKCALLHSTRKFVVL